MSSCTKTQQGAWPWDTCQKSKEIKKVSIPKSHIPIGGRLQLFKSKWFKNTKDQKILDMISGISIDVTENVDQNRFVHELKFIPEEQQTINQQIKKLFKKRAVVPCKHDNIQLISNIFVTPKKNGGYRTILNLKKFNEYVDKIKFKMEHPGKHSPVADTLLFHDGD